MEAEAIHLRELLTRGYLLLGKPSLVGEGELQLIPVKRGVGGSKDG
jgi:hypothetical protein